MLTVVDTYSHMSPIIDPRFRYRGEDVVEMQEKVCGEIGYPKTVRVDNGSAFISCDMDLSAYQKDITLVRRGARTGGTLRGSLSRPGMPTDNVRSCPRTDGGLTTSLIEAFNSTFRSECLNAHWFLSLADACEKMERRRRFHNEERPHSAIGNIPPITLANSAGETSRPC